MQAPIEKIADAQPLARAIVNAIIEPLLVLDRTRRAFAASRSFVSISHATFQPPVEAAPAAAMTSK